MKKTWKCENHSEEEMKRICDKFHVSSLIAKILINRKFNTDEEIAAYIAPDISKIYDPYLMEDMEIAVERILQAIDKKQKVVVYGDYDVDGITSITVLKKYFLDLGLNVNTYLPNRLDEGYGLNLSAIDKIANEQTDLVITVDCGISAISEIEYAKQKGLEVIVTDHHECGDVLPKALAVINPKRPNTKYPFAQLAGVGVAFKLIQAISMKLGLPKESYLKYLDIVCIGTIADIVPLVDENRIIAKNGLEQLKNTNNIGMKALMKRCCFTKVDSGVISFGLSPRINACGRIRDPQKALDIFLEDDPQKAEELAIELDEANVERQNIERKIFENAKSIIENSSAKDEPIIILGADDWHHGVIGIVASKLVDLYAKPCILVCFEGNEGKASGRSLPHFDLFSAVSSASDLLERFGGHEMAVGLTIKKENFEEFRRRIVEYTKDRISGEYINEIAIDAVIKSSDLSLDTMHELKRLEPFGERNPLPLFVYRNLKIEAIRVLANDKHLKLSLKDNQRIYEAIAFNLGELKNNFMCGDKVDIVHTLEINEFNGVERIQFNVKDIMKSI